MSASTTARRIAILATDGFEQAELEKPRDALRQADFNGNRSSG